MPTVCPAKSPEDLISSRWLATINRPPILSFARRSIVAQLFPWMAVEFACNIEESWNAVHTMNLSVTSRNNASNARPVIEEHRSCGKKIKNKKKENKMIKKFAHGHNTIRRETMNIFFLD